MIRKSGNRFSEKIVRQIKENYAASGTVQAS